MFKNNLKLNFRKNEFVFISLLMYIINSFKVPLQFFQLIMGLILIMSL